MAARKLLLLGLGMLSPFILACDDTECGDGTVEVDGVCIAADTDASTETGDDGDSATASNSATASKGDDESNSTGGGGEPYQTCPAQSDVQCAANETCIDLTLVCAADCSEDNDCPGPSDGTSVQRCEGIGDVVVGDRACVLFCSGGLVCPEGMSCEVTQLRFGSSEDTLESCVWS